ncbi:MAG TPA: hypothetical protein PLL69_11035 [Gemmatimonadales bacterium]|nr:hypothetical protein [Gemmatimonadales bacterium]
MLSILFQTAGMAPSDCALYGFCAEVIQPRSIPSGVMYLAVGLVLTSGWLWRRDRTRRSGIPRLSADS